MVLHEILITGSSNVKTSSASTSKSSTFVLSPQ